MTIGKFSKKLWRGSKIEQCSKACFEVNLRRVALLITFEIGRMCKQTIVGRLWFGADTAQGALSRASNPKLEKFCKTFFLPGCSIRSKRAAIQDLQNMRIIWSGKLRWWWWSRWPARTTGWQAEQGEQQKVGNLKKIFIEYFFTRLSQENVPSWILRITSFCASLPEIAAFLKAGFA